jgi:hypothetical protein
VSNVLTHSHSGVVAVSMGNDGFRNRLPGVDIKIALRTVNSFISEF